MQSLRSVAPVHPGILKFVLQLISPRVHQDHCFGGFMSGGEDSVLLAGEEEAYSVATLS